MILVQLGTNLRQNEVDFSYHAQSVHHVNHVRLIAPYVIRDDTNQCHRFIGRDLSEALDHFVHCTREVEVFPI